MYIYYLPMYILHKIISSLDNKYVARSGLKNRFFSILVQILEIFFQ